MFMIEEVTLEIPYSECDNVFTKSTRKCPLGWGLRMVPEKVMDSKVRSFIQKFLTQPRARPYCIWAPQGLMKLMMTNDTVKCVLKKYYFSLTLGEFFLHCLHHNSSGFYSYFYFISHDTIESQTWIQILSKECRE